MACADLLRPAAGGKLGKSRSWGIDGFAVDGTGHGTTGAAVARPWLVLGRERGADGGKKRQGESSSSASSRSKGRDSSSGMEWPSLLSTVTSVK